MNTVGPTSDAAGAIASAARTQPRLAAPGRSASVSKGYGFGYALLIPPLILYGYFILYPLIQTAYFALTSWDGAKPVKEFIGLGNFERMASDPLFWGAFLHTLIWVVLGTIVTLVLALALAMFVWNRPRGFLFFRTIYFMPQVLPAVVVGFVWVWIYSPLFGILNRFLKAIGLGQFALGWLGDPNVALYAVLAASIWAHIGLIFVIFVAALQNVDGELLDAAKIDGANAWQRFRYVVIPQLSNAITLVTVLLLVNGLQGFDHVWVMTRGGPNESTQLLATYAYQKAFMENDIGYGSALSLILALIALIVSVLTVNARERAAAAQQ
jgi:ABC-type sugar transport system permease subunit